MKFFPLPLLLAAAGALRPALWADDKPANPSAAAAPVSTPAATPFPLPKQEPDVPGLKFSTKTGQEDRGFFSLHEKYVSIAKEGRVQLLFLGDSITENWARSGKEVWEKSFSQWSPASFGIGGDRTQHLLWRIENGELDGIKPKVTVIMIGTNNVPGDSAEGVARGVTKIVETVRARVPETKILLLAIFPRGQYPSIPQHRNPVRDELIRINEIIARLADNQHIFFMDIGAKFLQSDGTMSKDIIPDFTHPNEAGYQIWADAIMPKLAEWMK